MWADWFVSMANYRFRAYIRLAMKVSVLDPPREMFSLFTRDSLTMTSMVAPFYQPETAHQIFNRVMFDRDVATGDVAVGNDYATLGVDSAYTRSDSAPKIEASKCYLWDILETCSADQVERLLSDKAIVRDFVLID